MRYILLMACLAVLLGAGMPRCDPPPAPPAGGLYYAARRDYRRCPAPLCGGWFVRAVNQPITQCPDAPPAAECYVASLVSETPVASNQALLMHGRLEAYQDPSFGTLARLVVDEVWYGATQVDPEHPFYRVGDSGLRCITAPCFFIDETRLNHSDPREATTLSSLNLTSIGADQRQIDLAWQAWQQGHLIVAGTHRTVPDAGPAGDGLVLDAAQFYLQQ